MSLPTARFRPLIEAISNYYNLPQGLGFLPFEWLEALIITESSGNSAAIRYEPGIDPNHQDDGGKEDSKSYGLMQVMGFNVKHYLDIPKSTPIDYSFMFDPLANISFGLRLLKENLIACNGDVGKALARYNGGPWGSQINIANGKLNCQDYVDKIVYNAVKVREDRR